MILAAVLAGACDVLDDFARLEALIGCPWHGLIIAVNDVGADPDLTRPIDHHVTLHPEKMAKWRKRRAELGLPPVGCTWALGKRESPMVDRVTFDKALKGGSSGMLGVIVARNECGADRVVLCGCPMDDRPNKCSGRPWSAYARYRRPWETHRDKLRGFVRSVSQPYQHPRRATIEPGWTRELLGEPTREWLLGLDEREAA